MSNNFLTNIPQDELEVIKEDLFLLSSDRSMNFCPVFIEPKDGRLLISREDMLEPDELVNIFSDAAVYPSIRYDFNDSKIKKLLSDEEELYFLSDIVALLDMHSMSSVEEIELFTDLLIALKEEGFSLEKSLPIIEGLDRDEFNRLITVFEESLEPLASYFRRLIIQPSEDEDDNN